MSDILDAYYQWKKETLAKDQKKRERSSSPIKQGSAKSSGKKAPRPASAAPSRSPMTDVDEAQKLGITQETLNGINRKLNPERKAIETVMHLVYDTKMTNEPSEIIRIY
jgi:hypothetical protein